MRVERRMRTAILMLLLAASTAAGAAQSAADGTWNFVLNQDMTVRSTLLVALMSLLGLATATSRA